MPRIVIGVLLGAILLAGAFATMSYRGFPSTNGISETTTPASVSVSFAVDGVPTTTTLMPQGSSAWDLMVALRNQGELQFTSKTYAGLDELIESINGTESDPVTGRYWTYFINDEEAMVGIAQYQLKDGDTISWRRFKK